MRNDAAASRAQATLDAVKNNPQRGDNVRNRSALDHQTRTVADRFFGGDVWYFYDVRSRYRARCTLAEWKIFCEHGRVTAKRRP